MRSFALRKSSGHFSLALVVLLALALSACQQGSVTNTNVNANTSNTTTVANSNQVTTAVPASSVINTREPEKYSATLVFTAETEGGDKAIAIPTVSAEVARNGQQQRLSFKLPNNEQLVYIDSASTHYVVSPTRKQYAELTPEATGFEIQRLMTPGQIVKFLEKQQGYERAGEEQINGRTAEKYRYTKTATTGTQAGNVQSEAFVYVDKETGLPLRATLTSQASGSVEGVKGVRIVAELRDIKTDVDPTLFEVPTDYSKVTPQQVRQQIDVLTNTVAAVVKAILTNMNTQASSSSTTTTTTTTTTTASPSPSASASPAGH
jgi:hypothetical protein